VRHPPADDDEPVVEDRSFNAFGRWITRPGSSPSLDDDPELALDGRFNSCDRIIWPSSSLEDVELMVRVPESGVDGREVVIVL